MGLLVTTLAVVLSSFHVYTAGFGLLDEIKHRSFHLTLVLVLCFLVFPRERVPRDLKGAAGPWAWGLVFGAFYIYLAWALVDRVGLAGTAKGAALASPIGFIAFISLPIQRFGGLGNKTSWVDWPLAAAAASISLYFLAFFDDVFIGRVGSPIAQDYMMGVLAIVIVMEAQKRTMGPMLSAIGMGCLLYALSAATCPACSRTAGTRSTASSTTSTSAPKASTGSPSAWSRPTSSISCCSASSRR